MGLPGGASDTHLRRVYGRRPKPGLRRPFTIAYTLSVRGHNCLQLVAPSAALIAVHTADGRATMRATARPAILSFTNTGAAVSGATAASYSISAVARGNAGSYYVNRNEFRRLDH